MKGTSMTSAIRSIPSSGKNPAAPRPRRSAAVLTAAALASLAALVGGYGAVYFTALDGWTPMSQTYVVTYEATSLFGLVCAVVLLFGRGPVRFAARYGLAAYASWLTYFTLFKIIRFSEYQAVPFGVVGLLVLALSLSAPVPRWAS
jgi:hypothetical protein